MAAILATLVLTILTAKSAAWPAWPANSSNKSCVSFSVPLPVTAQHHTYNIVHINSNIDATSYAVDLDTWDNSTIQDRIIGNITIAQTYDIHMKLCIPSNGQKRNYLQLLTHGAGFDSRYWDPEYASSNYSYVNATLAAGYSVLIYDRLGTGQSSLPNAYTEVQAPAEVEILRSISELARSGQIWDHVPESAVTRLTFEKIIHVGHSYGSGLTYATTSLYPNLSDAVVFTGFILNQELFQQRVTAQAIKYAPMDDAALFGNFTSGYAIPGSASAYQTGFFSSRANQTLGLGGFDPQVLDYAYTLRQPTGATALGSLNVLLLPILSVPAYAGPVQFVLGEFDFLICLADCRGTYNVTEIEAMWPKAKNISIYLQPGTGHALPYHYGARVGFQKTYDWLAQNGL